MHDFPYLTRVHLSNQGAIQPLKIILHFFLLLLVLLSIVFPVKDKNSAKNGNDKNLNHFYYTVVEKVSFYKS